jgi:hypothetical protein
VYIGQETDGLVEQQRDGLKATARLVIAKARRRGVDRIDRRFDVLGRGAIIATRALRVGHRDARTGVIALCVGALVRGRRLATMRASRHRCHHE